MPGSGLPLRRFFNTSGLVYKALNLRERLDGMSEDEQLRLLATDGMLVKRPLIVRDDLVLTGFRETEWAAPAVTATKPPFIYSKSGLSINAQAAFSRRGGAPENSALPFSSVCASPIFPADSPGHAICCRRNCTAAPISRAGSSPTSRSMVRKP